MADFERLGPLVETSLVPFFKPKGVVVIGASTSPEKLGYGVARNLVQSGYSGAIHFVSQKEGELFGHRLYNNVSQVPEPIDLAVLILPPDVTPKTIEDCGKRGIRAAIIMSSGFREVGTEGAALEQQCLEIARTQGMRLLGPNCVGTLDTHLPLDTSFLRPPMPTPGHIGFISQSGAFCAAIIDWARMEGFGFSQIISLGNSADVDETDMLAALADDEHTRVIVLYIESVSDGRRFVERARQVTRQKPVIALKVGRFDSGQKAAASHTGALAASDTTFDAAFDKAGILRADSAEQMFDWARVLETYPRGLDTLKANTGYLPGGLPGIAVLTNAGGPGVIAADALEKNGLQLAQLSESARQGLADQLPPAASIHNPVDMLASASPNTYASCLRILLQDKHVAGVTVILPPPPLFKAEDVAEKLVESMQPNNWLLADSGATSPSNFKKPVVIALMGSTLIEKARSILERAHVPIYPFPERAASALGALFKRTEVLVTETHGALQDSPMPRSSVMSTSLEELLKAYDIPIAPTKLACSSAEAISIANELGYPIVMKVASPDIVHKSDVGGVALDIKNPPSLALAYTQMLERVQTSKPEARIEGVYLQRQIPDGQEVIVGAVRDPLFGPLMMFGSGGVEVEGLKDVAFALAPLTQAEAVKMIRKTWAGRKLRGFRHIPPADEQAAVDILVSLSRLVLENESIQEMEINPLRVLGKGAVAVDVRIK